MGRFERRNINSEGGKEPKWEDDRGEDTGSENEGGKKRALSLTATARETLSFRPRRRQELILRSLLLCLFSPLRDQFLLSLSTRVFCRRLIILLLLSFTTGVTVTKMISFLLARGEMAPGFLSFMDKLTLQNLLLHERAVNTSLAGMSQARKKFPRSCPSLFFTFYVFPTML